MKINQLTIRGFRSFSKSQTWFPVLHGPGLYHLTGRNEAEPALEANGAGKSSSYEALFWVFYGRTSRGLKAGSVQCWLPGAPPCCVTVDFEHAGDRWLLTRTWNPNSLLLSSPGTTERPVDQQEIERRIGVGPEAFLQAIYFAQFTPAFVDLSPSDRLSLFSEVMNLDKWEHAASRASAQVKELTADASLLERKKASAEGELKGLDLMVLTENAIGWSSVQTQKIKTLEKEKDRLAADLSKKQRAVELLKRVEEQEAGSLLPSNLKQLQALLTSHENSLVTASSALQRKETVESSAKRERSRFVGLTLGDACPVCSKPVEAEHVAREISRLDEEIARIQAEIEPLQLASEQAADLIAATRIQIEEERKRIHQEELLKQKQLQAHKEIALAEKYAAQALENAERILAASSAEENPYEASLKRAEVRQKALLKEMEELVELSAEVSRASAAYSYWMKGFKELRLYVVNQVLAQLEIETSNTMLALGLSNWGVKFTVEQETKSGTFKRGLSVLIHAPGAPEAVPFEAWSGGESQRLRLAISMGLSGLISGQLGLDCNVEIYDEPTTWMSDGGITELLGVLRERAEHSGKAIWLADHRSLDYGGFAGGLCAVKTEQGTILETASDNLENTQPAVLNATPRPKAAPTTENR